MIRRFAFYLLGVAIGGFLVVACDSAHAQEFTAADFAVMGIDAATVFYVWSWGFGSVVMSWFFGFVIGVAQTAVRKL